MEEPPTPQDADTVAVRRIRREERRARNQRTASAQRRAALLQDGKEQFGSREALSRHLGISGTAISKAIARAAERSGDDVPPVSYIEIELPTAGDAVIGFEEWQKLPDGEKAAAARVVAAAWTARSDLLLWMFYTAERKAALFGKVRDRCSLRLDGMLIGELCEELRKDAPDLPEDLMPHSVDSLADAVTLNTEVAASLRTQLIACWLERDRWHERAHLSYE